MKVPVLAVVTTLAAVLGGCRSVDQPPMLYETVPDLEGFREQWILVDEPARDGSYDGETTYTLRNVGREPVVLTGASVTTSTVLDRARDDFPLTIAPGQAVEFTVRGRLDGRREKRARATLTTEGGDALELVLGIRLRTPDDPD